MNRGKDIKIYSFYYKDTIIPIKNELYCPVMAGNALHPTKMNIEGDDRGISISEKNFFYSELTGIYWVWKNRKQNITGSCHYRRYFTAKKEPFDLQLKRILFFMVGLYRKRYGLIYTNNIHRFKKRILNSTEIVDILHTHDAILPQRRKLKYSVKKHYQRYHNSSDLEKMREILMEKHPEYLSSFDHVLNDNRLYANNMFVLSDIHFQKFMNWWFPVLFDFEKKIQLDDYSGYQQRILGFMGERLLTVWFYHAQLKVKELPVIYFKKIKFREDNMKGITRANRNKKFREKSPKIYFVHIPKNAGNSIRKICKNENITVISHNIRRKNKRLLAAYRGKKRIHAFCISRNPYDRTVSAYHYLLSDGQNKTKHDETDCDQFIKPYSDFKDFVKNGLREAAEKQLHFLPQVFWIYNKKGIPEVETILKMENLENDFPEFCKKMNLNLEPLTITNTSGHKSWDEYYDNETKKIVADIYHCDFEFFNYKK